jgi:hypothetical protein
MLAKEFFPTAAYLQLVHTRKTVNMNCSCFPSDCAHALAQRRKLSNVIQLIKINIHHAVVGGEDNANVVWKRAQETPKSSIEVF